MAAFWAAGVDVAGGEGVAAGGGGFLPVAAGAAVGCGGRGDGHGGLSLWVGGRVGVGGVPLAQGLLQGVDELLVQFGGGEDAHVGQPVLHDGQQLPGVADVGVDEQAAVGLGADELPGQELAAAEVVGDGGGHAQGGFLRLGGEPDFAFGFGQVLLPVFGDGKGRAFAGLQLVDEGEGEAFDFVAGRFVGGEVPDAAVVGQAVGVHLAGLVFVEEGAGGALLHGGLQGGEVAALGAEVFAGRGVHLQAALGGGGVELGEQVVQAFIGQQVGGAGKFGVALEVAQRDGAAALVGELPLAVFVALGDAAQALVQIALDGAHVHAEFLGQRVFVDAVLQVELGEDVGQAEGEGVVRGLGLAHVGFLFLRFAAWAAGE